MKTRYLRHNIAISMAVISVLAIAVKASAAQSDFNQLVVFGDSLMDTGNYGAGRRFTNETSPGSGVYQPIAADYLANGLGLSLTPAIEGGTNYAVGGYRVANILNSIAGTGIDTSSSPTGGTAPAYLTQVGGAISSKTLVLMDGGGNDIRDIVIGNISTPENIPDQLRVAVTTYLQGVQALADAGADYIIVANAPDLSLTPGVEAFDKVLLPGAGAAAGFSQASAGYNGAIESLAAFSLQGVNLIPFDIEGALNYLFDNAETYGFASGEVDIGGGTLVNQFSMCYDGSGGGCVEHPVFGINGTAPNPRALFFNDELHPTESASELFGDYLLDIIQAPQTIGLLPELATDAARSQLVSVRGEMRRSRWSENLAESGEGRLYISGVVSNQELENGLQPETDNQFLQLGRTFVASEHTLYGLAVSVGQQELDVDGAEFEADFWGLSGMMAYRQGRFFVDSNIGLTVLALDDLQREFALGDQLLIAEGETDGYAWAADVLAGYKWLATESWKLAPAIGVQYVHSVIDGYTESGGTVSNYAWGNQKRKSLELRAGLVTEFAVNQRLNLFAEFFAVQEQEDQGDRISIRNTNLSFSSYQLPSFAGRDDNFATLSAGVWAAVGNGNLQLTVELSDRGDGGEQAMISYSLPFK